MIKSNELRIGNWVQDEHDDIQYVYRIWQNGVELSADATGSDDLDYEDKELFGIPLTENVLKKCGFIDISSSIEKIFQFAADKRFCFYGSTGEICVEFDTGIGGSGYELYTETRFLHQLQNLYFTITGDELHVNW